MGFLVALIPLPIYLFCLSPCVSWEDSGEFITTAATLGIAHPPGHPLYIICAHLFAISRPALSVAHSINFFSAFAAFLALFAFSILIQVLAPSRLPYNNRFVTFVSVISVTMLFAFSKTFWSVAEIAEVYTLHALLSLCLISSLVLLAKRGGTALFLFAYLLGLSLTNNVTIGYLIPAFVCFLILERKRINRKHILPSLLFFLLGISLYSFIPIRARFQPVFNWGDAHTLKNLLHLLTASHECSSKQLSNRTFPIVSYPSTLAASPRKAGPCKRFRPLPAPWDSPAHRSA